VNDCSGPRVDIVGITAGCLREITVVYRKCLSR
jgi:hypothetical protein